MHSAIITDFRASLLILKVIKVKGIGSFLLWFVKMKMIARFISSTLLLRLTIPIYFVVYISVQIKVDRGIFLPFIRRIVFNDKINLDLPIDKFRSELLTSNGTIVASIEWDYTILQHTLI